jgi:PadR family transcriptional regulator AphA
MMEVKPYRLTSTSYAVLALLEALGEATPYDLKRALVTSIENFWRVPHTTFYEEPARLERAGYLAVRQEQGGRRRRLYTPTERGREALRAWAQDPQAAPEQVRDEGLLKIFAGGDPEAILRERIGYHRAKLAEFEGYLAAVGSTLEAPERNRRRGAEVTLAIGISYHRDMAAMIERFLRGEPLQGEASRAGTRGGAGKLPKERGASVRRPRPRGRGRGDSAA